MADSNSTKAILVGSDSGAESIIDLADYIGARLSILSANLAMIHGNGFDNFDESSEDLKEPYLWGCARHAKECAQRFGELTDMINLSKLKITG